MATQTELPRGRPPLAAPGRAARVGPLDVAVVAGPALLGLALCLYQLTGRSLWLDEAATVAIAQQHGSALWHAIAHDGGNMLGYYLLAHVLIGWFGHGALVIRLPSALAAGAATGAVSLFALRRFDRRAALGAGVFSAVSLPLVFWGQDARGYALMVALVAGSFLALAEAVQDPRRRGPWIVYALLTGLSVYASYVALFALPAQLVVLVRRRSAWRPMAGALGACGLAWIPLAVLAATRGSGQLFWIPRPNLTGEKQVMLALTSAGFEPNFHLAAGAAVLAVLSVLLLVVGAARAGLVRDRAALLAVSWLVVPVVLMWLESLIAQPLFTARNALVSLPAAALLLGWVTTRIRLGWVVVAGLIALRALQLAPSYGTSPENWRAATAYVRGATRPGDCLAFYPLDARMPFAYYAGWPMRPYVERYQTPRVAANCTRVWLVASHEGQPSGPAEVRAHYARYLAVRAMLSKRYGPASTRSFGYASVIWVQLFSR